MKLSQMTTIQLADALVALTVPIANIAEDSAVMQVMSDARGMYNGKAPIIEMAGLVARRIIPLALRDHRDDLLEILAALTGKTKATIGKQNGMETIREAMACFDKDLLGFFGSSAPTGGGG